MVTWEQRFRWLWEQARDGFDTPDGWWSYDAGQPTDEELRKIDGWIEEEEVNDEQSIPIAADARSGEAGQGGGGVR